MRRGMKSVISHLSEQNKSALTGHASHDNYWINWLSSTVLDRESDRSTIWIKEVVHIRKEGQRSMNQDEGSYTHTINFLPRHITIVAKLNELLLWSLIEVEPLR